MRIGVGRVIGVGWWMWMTSRGGGGRVGNWGWGVALVDGMIACSMNHDGVAAGRMP